MQFQKMHQTIIHKLFIVALLLIGSINVTYAQTSDTKTPGFEEESLIGKAEKEGSVKIIVGIELPRGFKTEGELATSQAIKEQRAMIAAIQQRLLDSLRGQDVKIYSTYKTIPYLALEVDTPALEKLFESTLVNDIQEDGLDEPTLASSTVVIGAPDVWSLGMEGAGQTVVILDIGIDASHPFFGSRVVDEACFSNNGGGGLSLCPNGNTTQTGSGAADATIPNCDGGSLCDHGTHVAGIAAGSSNAFNGVAPGADIIAIQVFTRFGNDVGAYISDQLDALEYIATDLSTSNNIAAVNMSLGSGNHTDQTTCDAANTSRKLAIDNLRSMGIATIIASGNNGWTNAMSSPGCISSAIGVGSTTDTDAVSWFTNMHEMVDLLAPGSSVESSVPGGGYAIKSGTSMATPHVAGAWAVLKANQPSASVDDILTQLENTGVLVTDTRPGGTVTKPRIQLDAAIVSPGNNGTGIFIDSGQTLGNRNSLGTTLADFDADGDLDAAVGNYSQDAAIWMNDGTGTFSLSQSLATDKDTAVVSADLDGDGDVDLVFADNFGPVTVWINNGSGTFSNSGQSLGNSNNLDLALGDMDNDADIDIVVGSNGGNQIWLNNGSGTFSSSQSLGNSASWGVDVGDLDDDGDLDIYFANSGADKVWINNGTGTFSSNGQSLGSATGRDVALGDIDGDADLDAFIINTPGQVNKVWLNNGSGTFSDSGQSIGTLNGEVALGDFDGDSDIDAFLANLNGANQVWDNDGTGIFSNSGQSLGNSKSGDVAIGDVDNDNDLDAFVVNQQGQANKVWLNENDQEAATAIYFSSSTGGNVDGVPFRDEDILAFNPATGGWALYFDGSDVGLNTRDVNAFHVLDDGNLLMSFNAAITLGGTSYDDSDVVRFSFTSPGSTTVGTFSLYFDGSDVGLTSNGEDIDALSVTAGGDLIISTLSTASVPGLTAPDEDLLRFIPSSLGTNTSGTWSHYLDGSDVSLSNWSEDVWATWIDQSTGEVHLSTAYNYNVGSLSGDGDDIFICDPVSLGNSTSCNFSLFWDGDNNGFGNERIDGYTVGPLPTGLIFSASVNRGNMREETPEIDDTLDDDVPEQIYLPLIMR